MQKLQGFARMIPSGLPAPVCTVSVFNAGTAVLSTLFNDNIGTPQNNPFTADVNAIWFFYAANGRYDVQFSGAGIGTPYTLSDFLLADP